MNCPKCGEKMRLVTSIEDEEVLDESIHAFMKTGRRIAIPSHLECDNCLHMELVDDDYKE